MASHHQQQSGPTVATALEPVAVTLLTALMEGRGDRAVTDDELTGFAVLSAAASLKRIADALAGDGPAFLNGLEGLAWNCGQAFERGRSAG